MPRKPSRLPRAGWCGAVRRWSTFSFAMLAIMSCSMEESVFALYAERKQPQKPVVPVLAAQMQPAKPGTQTKTDCTKLHPRIQHIGDGSILTFEGPEKAGNSTRTRELIIPVEARDLFNECVALGIFVSGTVPANIKSDWETTNWWNLDEDKPNKSKSKRADVIGIKLKAGYLDRLKSGDRLNVHILISDRPKTRLDNPRQFRHYIVRRFTVYDTEFYREKVLSNQVPLHEVEAYPLPEEEAEALFGLAVSKNFFAVRMTVKNTQDFDKLINTGLIVARGRALVEPWPETAQLTGNKPRELRYTVPVAVTPQSDKQMYTILDDRQPFTTRNWIFRGLDFIGSLAAVTGAAYGSAGVVEGIGIFTGTANPGLKELFPDRFLTYKRNMVAYAMTELIRVPRRASVGHRYLFFSKNKIQGLIMNQEIYGAFKSEPQPGNPEAYEPLLRNTEIPRPPKVALVSLQFDHLEIPFERVVGNLEMSVRDRVAKLEAVIPKKLTELEGLQQRWLKVDKNGDGDTDAGQETTEFLGGMTHPQLATLAKKVTAALKVLKPLAEDATRKKAAKDYQDALKVLQKLKKAAKPDDAKIKAQEAKVKSLEKAGKKAVAIFEVFGGAKYFEGLADMLTPKRIEAEFLKNNQYGIDALKAIRVDMQEVSTAIVGGRDPDLLDTRVKAAESRMATLGNAFRFYLDAAGRIKKGDLFKIPGTDTDLSALGKAEIEKLNATALEGLATDMSMTKRQLEELRSGLTLKVEKTPAKTSATPAKKAEGKTGAAPKTK